MDVLTKVVTAIRGGLTEVGEAIVDKQALRILEQEIRDAAEELDQSKDALASMIARQKLSEEKIARLQASIEENEAYAVKALEKADEALARDLAGKVADLEAKLNSEHEIHDSYRNSANKQRAAIAKAEKDVRYMKNQLDTLKATENVQRAEAAVSERHSGTSSKLRTAMESLERIKEKQALTDAQAAAAHEIAAEEHDKSIEQRLIDAGIKGGTKTDDVFDRIKQKST